jgi:hypothetical protein
MSEAHGKPFALTEFDAEPRTEIAEIGNGGAMPQLTAEQLAITEKLNSILFPYAWRKRKAMMSRNGRFVHYTSAENALKIISNKCIWMRSTTCMMDYREVHHGYDALRRYFADGANRDAFITALNGCSSGVAEQAVAQFDQSLQANQLQTYITSSEHDDREDAHGRLSMWRAFGNSTARVAIVIKLDLEIGINLSLGAELSPVAYFTDREFADELNAVVANISANKDFLRSIDRSWLLASVHTMLTSAMVCLKHEGFEEEREWRVIHSPARHSPEHIQQSIEVVAGVPQRICKILLRSDAEVGLTGLNPNELIDRIIIGPTQYPFAMLDAFVSGLTDVGVADAAKRVVVSQIPVRT